MKYQVLTDVVDETIIQKLIYNKGEELSRWVCDTREKAVIQALISLGWTPPNKPLKRENHDFKPKSSDGIDEALNFIHGFASSKKS